MHVSWLALSFVLISTAHAEPSLDQAFSSARAALAASHRAALAARSKPRPNPDAPAYQPQLWNDTPEQRVKKFFEDQRAVLDKVEAAEGELFTWKLAKIFYFRDDGDLSARYGISQQQARGLRAAFEDATRGVRYRTNCYAYALNSPYGHPAGWKAYPGHKGGLGLEDLKIYDPDGREYVRRARADGVLPGSPELERKPGYYAIALFIREAPEYDYHFVRQDGDGTWSSKPGEDEASNLDFEGQRILDPRKADFWGYHFKTFLYVPKGGIDVTPPPAH